MSRTINFYVKTTLGALVENALVRVFTTVGAFVTEATTNVSGKAGPLVLADGSYELVVSKQGFVFPTPYVLTVSADGDFDLTGTAPTTPTASDPNRCRIYGVLRSPSGAVLKGATIVMSPLTSRMIAGGDVIVGDVRRQTDKNGVLDVELYRGVSYYVRVPYLQAAYSWTGSNVEKLEEEHFTDMERPVPNQSALDLASFLWPQPARVQFSSSSVTLAAGSADSSIKASVVETNGVVASDARTEALEYKSADNAVALVSVAVDGTITINGVSPGTTTISVTRKSYPPTTIPVQGLTVDSFTITVT